MLPKTYPVASPLFTFRREMLVICCIEHRLIESEMENDGNVRGSGGKAQNANLKCDMPLEYP